MQPLKVYSTHCNDFIPLTKYAYLLLHTGSGTVYQLWSFLLVYKLFYPKFYILLQNLLEFSG